ncbi:MAG: TetR family transcriptional regulator [Streptosporangiales bacterium]|nr:TetR family transcriptional regulator [Streptosporangiales bacterium]
MSTRDRMLDAAAEVMRTRGLARSTTKEIARAAGYSEAALYKHFTDKTELFLAVLEERGGGDFNPLLTSLPELVGTQPVAEVLQTVARSAVEFYEETFPIGASLFSEPRLLAAHREALRARNAGPQHVSAAVAAYLADERDRGRISSDVDPTAAAALLVGACLHFAFLRHFTGEEQDDKAKDEFAAGITTTLLAGLADR